MSDEAMPPLGLSGTILTVTRTPTIGLNEIVLIDGEMFEDGKRRAAVGYDVPQEVVRMLTTALDDLHVAKNLADAIDTITSNWAEQPKGEER